MVRGRVLKRVMEAMPKVSGWSWLEYYSTHRLIHSRRPCLVRFQALRRRGLHSPSPRQIESSLLSVIPTLSLSQDSPVDTTLLIEDLDSNDETWQLIALTLAVALQRRDPWFKQSLESNEGGCNINEEVQILSGIFESDKGGE